MPAKTSRAMWKGGITLPSARVPVKVHAALEDRTVRFRLLHASDQQPVVQRMVEPQSGDVVPHEAVRRGVETEEGAFVIVHPEELAALEPDASRDIEVLRFVPRGAVDLPWYDRPYWLAPDSHDEAYAALVRALEETGRIGIVRWVMRKREYVGALFARERRLGLVTLHHADAMIPASALPRPSGAEPTAKEIALARQLVGALEDSFDPAAHEDEYRERVLELIERKARGKPIERRRPPPEKREAASLTQMLEASLKKRPPKPRKEKRVA
jgi:DNA end-binding protein Ku